MGAVERLLGIFELPTDKEPLPEFDQIAGRSGAITGGGPCLGEPDKVPGIVGFGLYEALVDLARAVVVLGFQELVRSAKVVRAGLARMLLTNTQVAQANKRLDVVRCQAKDLLADRDRLWERKMRPSCWSALVSMSSGSPMAAIMRSATPA